MGRHGDTASINHHGDLTRFHHVAPSPYLPVAASPRPRVLALRVAVAEGFEPSIAGLTIRCLTNLATPQEIGFKFQVQSFRVDRRTWNLKLGT